MSSTQEAARLRLLTAQKFYGTSTQILQQAKDQLEIAQKELKDATDYLEELENKSDRNKSHRISNNTKSETVNNGNETVVDSVVDSSSSVDIVRKVSSDSPIQATTSNNNSNNVDEGEDSEQDNHLQGGVYVDYLMNRETEIRDNTTYERKHNIKAQSVVVSPTSSSSNNKSDYNTSITDQSTLSSHSPCNWVEVSESGIPQINGRYHRFEISDGVSSFSKIDTYEGKEAIFTIGRWDQSDGSKKWCITGTVPPNKQLGFYVAYAPSFVRHPPLKNWMSITENGEPSYDYIGQGNQNVPTIMHEPDPYLSIQNLPLSVNNSKEGASKSSTRKGRNRRRSVSNPRSIRNGDRSASTGRYRI